MSDKENELYPNLNNGIVDAKIKENNSFQFSLTNLIDIKNFYEDKKFTTRKNKTNTRPKAM